MSETEIALVTLSRDECLALLIAHRPRLGRLAFIDDGWPLVLPMNYVVRGESIFFRSAHGSKLEAAIRAEKVAFEVDQVDEVWEEGWSILAFGRLRVITDPGELAEVRQLPLRPWAGGDKPYHLRLDIDALSGRRIT